MYPAEFGGKASALINVVTKSGGNAFHGSALEFVRNETFDARNYFDDPDQADAAARARTSSASTSAVRSSAIGRFFFFSYEGQRIRKAQTQTFSVPTAALRAGDFSGLAAALRSADAHGRRRLHAVCRQPDSGRTASIRSPRRSCAKVPLPTSGGPRPEPARASEDEVNPMNQFSLQDRSSASARATTCTAAFTTFRVHDTQPFGTSSLNETLVPGLRPDGDHDEREPRARLHAHVRLELAERDPLRLSAARAADR